MAGSMSGSSGMAAAGPHVSPLSKFAQTVSSQFGQHWRAVGAASALGSGLALTLTAGKVPAIREKKDGTTSGLMEQLQENYGSHFLFRNSVIAALSLSSEATAAHVEELVEPKTGVVFPAASPDGKQLTGIGLRKKSILGLKSITVYAYGLYADPDTLKSVLGDKYGSLKPEEAQKTPDLFDDVTEKDVGLTVRLVIVYGKLKMGAIRSAFEGSVGSGIKKFSGEENKELLRSFTSIFKDDMKLPRGTTIDITRLPGQVLQTKIDGQDIGSVQSPLLCRALFDLYLGDEAFDKAAKETMGSGFAHLLSS